MNPLYSAVSTILFAAHDDVDSVERTVEAVAVSDVVDEEAHARVVLEALGHLPRFHLVRQSVIGTNALPNDPVPPVIRIVEFLNT